MEGQEKENSAAAGNRSVDAVQQAWNNMLAQVKSTHIPHNFMYFQMENISKSTMVDDITTAYVLNNVKHLIIPRMVSDYVVAFHNNACQLKYEWTGAPGGANAAVWDRFMNPEMKKLQSFLKKENWKEAFASLFGIFIFDRRDAGSWIRDLDQPDFNLLATWLRKYTNSWKKLLERTDEEIGLYGSTSKPGIYREVLVDLLKKHQEYLNNHVLVKFDAAAPKKIRITIFPAEKSTKSPSRKGTTPQKKKAVPGSPTAVADVDTSPVSNPTSSPLQQAETEQLPAVSTIIAGPSTSASSDSSTKSPSRKRSTPQKKKDKLGSPTALPGVDASGGSTKSPSRKRKTPEKKQDAPEPPMAVAGIHTSPVPDTHSSQLQQQETLLATLPLPPFSTAVTGLGTVPNGGAAESPSDYQNMNEMPGSTSGIMSFDSAEQIVSPSSNQPMPQKQQEMFGFPMAHAGVDTCALAGASIITPVTEQSVPQMMPDSSTSVEGIDTSDVFGGPTMVRVLEDEFAAANLVQLQHDS